MKPRYTFLLLITATFLIFKSVYCEENYFVQNSGQWNKDLNFVSIGAKVNIAVGLNKIFFYKPEVNSIIKVYETEFINSTMPFIMPGEQAGPIFNFFKGNDPSKWIVDLKTYKSLRIANIYPGINLALMFENGNPRYDFIIQPGSNPEKVKMKITGSKSINVSNGQVVIDDNIQGLIHGNIKAYQVINNNQVEVPCSFEITDNVVSFKLGLYDKTIELIIDPIVFSDYIGGSNDDVVSGVKFDKNNNIVTVGYTNSTDYPSTSGSYSLTNNGEYDIIVNKYKIIGTTRELVFATYIGGGNTDIANALDLDYDGDIYITGSTISSDFPRINSAGFSYSGDQDAYLVKLSKTGDKLLNSSLFGGSKVDVGTSIAVNQNNKTAVIVGYSNSNNYPTYGSPAQSTNKGLYDAIITEVNSAGTSMVFSSYWGGTNNDKANAVAIDIDGTIFLGGETDGNFPVFPYRTNYWGQVVDKPFDPTYNGGIDGWAASMTNNGAIIYSTYFGGTADDRVTGVSFYSDGSIIIVGETGKEPGTPTFPTSDNAYSKTNKGGIDGFFARLDKIKTRQSGYETQKYQDLLFATMFGGSANDNVTGMAYNHNNEGLYICGTTNSSNFPTTGDDIQIKSAGKKDAYILELGIQANGILWSSYFGGSQDDYGLAVSMDSLKDAVLVGYTSSTDLIKPNINFQHQYQGGQRDGFISKFTKGTLNVTYPITNDKFCAGQPVDVKFNTTFFPLEEQFWIDFKLKPSDQWQSLTTTATNGTFRWNIPNNYSFSDSAMFRLVHPSGLWKLSDYFTIMAQPYVNIANVKPESRIACEGDAFIITTKVMGTNLSYKWYFDNNLLANQTSKDLIINNLTTANSGKYKVLLTGTCKPDASSEEVALLVNPATKITVEPKDNSVLKGQTVIFSVSSDGLNLTYQWLRNGQRILSAIQSSYQIDNVQKSSEGRYSCIVYGLCGSDTSYAAELKVDDKTGIINNYVSSSGISLISETNNIQVYKVFTSEKNGFEIRLFGLQGQLIKIIDNVKYENDGLVFEINNNDMPNGLYFINYYSVNTSVTSPVILLK